MYTSQAHGILSKCTILIFCQYIRRFGNFVCLCISCLCAPHSDFDVRSTVEILLHVTSQCIRIIGGVQALELQ